nr:hypothetical protein [Pseudopedobacter sp.]
MIGVEKSAEEIYAAAYGTFLYKRYRYVLTTSFAKVITWLQCKLFPVFFSEDSHFLISILKILRDKLADDKYLYLFSNIYYSDKLRKYKYFVQREYESVSCLIEVIYEYHAKNKNT